MAECRQSNKKLRSINDFAGTVGAGSAFLEQMKKFRFITPNRTGKWYPDLDSAKRFASKIGAGFLEGRTGRFVAYHGTRLEVAREGNGSVPAE